MLKLLFTNGCRLLLLISLSGCAILNTFETPGVLEPGDADVEFGFSMAPAALGQDSAARGFADRVPGAVLGHGYATWRVGLVERFEMSMHSGIGPKSIGVGSKLQLLRSPVLVAANAGVSYRDFGLNFYGSVSSETQAFYSGLLVGGERLYGGAKLTKLHGLRSEDCDRCESTTIEHHLWLPQISLGFAGANKVRPTFEANLYLAPEAVVTVGLAFRVAALR